MRFLLASFVAMGTLFSGPSVLAHEIFWQAGTPTDTLMVGHAGGDPQHGRRSQPCPPDNLVGMWNVGSGLSWEQVATGDQAVTLKSAVGTPTLVIIDWGWWCKTRSGNQPGRTNDVPAALRSWHSRETLLTLPQANASLPPIQFPHLTISPVADQPQAAPGRKLTFEVRRDGRLVPDAVVSYNGKERGISDTHGRIRLKLRSPGRQHITASVRSTLSSDPLTETIETAILTFDLEEQR